MRFIAGLCLAALCAFAAVPAAADMGAYPQSEQELQDAYDRLNWHRLPRDDPSAGRPACAFGSGCRAL